MRKMDLKTEIEPPELALDVLLSKYGAFGRYQIRAIIIIGFAFFTNSMHCVNYIFVAEDVPYRCKVEQCESEEVFASPWYNFTAPVEYRNCHQYSTNGSEICDALYFDSTTLEPCSEWVYEVKDSFVSEFGLACQDWKRTFVGTVHSIGLMIGLAFQGQLSDKIGRKGAIIIAGLAAALFGIAKSFANTYWLFITLELLEAVFGDNCSPAFIMSIELVNQEFRLHQQIFFSFIFCMGGVAMALAGYLVRYWRHFTIAIYAPSLIFILYIFIMDESVRWLLSKGKKEEATRILMKMAKTNRIEIDEKIIRSVKCVEQSSSSSPLLETLKSKMILRRFLVCLVWWTSCTFACFGLLINVVSLAGNKYLNFGIMSLCDIPASIAMVLVLKRFKRKKPLFTSFMLAALFCLTQPLVPKNYIWISTGLYFLGRFITTFTFATVYMYTSELFPTYSRNSMHALCSSIGRIGSILAPMTPLLMQYSESLPTFLIGGISFLAGLTTLLVPDVDNEALPDSVKQAECLGSCHIPLQKIDGSNEEKS